MSVTAYHFWSPTCAPCNHIKPAVQDLKEEFESVNWVSVNIAEDKVTAAKYGVTLVPTIAVEWNGRVEKHSGTSVAGYYRILRMATTQK